MTLNLRNHFAILKAWLLLETCHGKWVGLKFSQRGGLFSNMFATLTRPPRCMKLCGRITLLFIRWISVCHGDAKVYVQYVLGLKMRNRCFVFNAKCSTRKWGTMINMDSGYSGWWSLSSEIWNVLTATWLCLGMWGFGIFYKWYGRGKMIGNCRI